MSRFFQFLWLAALAVPGMMGGSACAAEEGAEHGLEQAAPHLFSIPLPGGIELPVSNSGVSYTASLLEVLAEINNGSSAPYERWITNLKQAERLEARLYKNSLRECDALDEVRTRPLPRYSALEEIINQPNRDYFDRTDRI